MTTSETTKSLHSRWQKLTGQTAPWTMSSHYRWERWAGVHGYTERDLSIVIYHIKDLIRQKRRFPQSFLLRNLLDDERFADDLSMAMALERERKDAGDINRNRVLKATGRDRTDYRFARTPEQIMAGSKAFEAFRKMKEEL